MEDIREYIKNRILVFDGGIGTELQRKGLPEGELPERWNITRPEAVQEIHTSFLEAGAMALTTNTFGANRIKLAEYGMEGHVRELNSAGVELACKAREASGRPAFVAGSIGPTGAFVEPLGQLAFDEVYQIFLEQAQALRGAGADVLILETMTDLGEARAALLAAKDAGGIPVIASMTYGEKGRTLTGTDPETAVVVLAGMGADVVGVNCSGGSEQLEPVAAILCASANVPVLVEPNAGLPEIIDGRTFFRETPESMAAFARRFAEGGASIIGSCCGSTPAHTRAIAAALEGLTPRTRHGSFPTRICSRSRTVGIGAGSYPTIIGERINPSGRKALAEEIRLSRDNIIKAEALAQAIEGAEVLDVNVGVPGIDEPEAMRKAVHALQGLVQEPLVLDSADPAALEAGLQAYHGRALVNSVTADDTSLNTVLPLARRFGAVVVGLCMDAGGIPAGSRDRLAAARKILDHAARLGMAREDIVIDCLTLSAGTDSESSGITLDSLEKVKGELGVATVLGVSNVSFGLPHRSNLNAAFLAAAVARGLDAAIINPADAHLMSTFRAAAVLAGRDKAAKRYIDGETMKDAGDRGRPAGLEAHRPETGLHPLTEAVIRGDREGIVPVVNEYLEQGSTAEEILDRWLLPGIETVGEKYGSGEYFLPQLMLAADAMQAAFSRLKPELERTAAQDRGTVVLAVVKGDIHDIGKNIVGIMLKNHGFTVVDLGKNVDTDAIVGAARENGAAVVGLSALMTTTMPRMGEVVRSLREAGVKAKVVVGGAAVTQRFAEEIGADAYGHDAVEAVEIVKGLVDV